MDRYKELPKQHTSASTSLPRNTSTCNFAELLRRQRRTRSRDSQKSRQSPSRVSIASSRQSTSNGSENSQILYMPGRNQRHRKMIRSLSSVANINHLPKNGKAHEEDWQDEQVSWNIIDREIFEWQNSCQSGRPYWWSPESKYTRLKRMSPRLGNGSHPKIWMREVDPRPKSDYAMQRRTVSDNYLTDPHKIQDLAQLVAVQLLSACFTLPPEDFIGRPSHTGGESPSCPTGPPMISSLRMHTHFQYSPSFGHQAQNTSPAQPWSGAFDGPSPSGIPPALEQSRNRRQSSHLRTRRKERSVSDDAGRSAACDVENDSFFGSCNSESDPSQTHGMHTSNCRTVSVPQSPNNRGKPGSSSRQRLYSQARYSSEQGDDEGNALYRENGAGPRSNYRLQPVIRSEPHPVFIQPVRDLVVQRWRSFRRRFSGSLYGSLPPRFSDDRISSESQASSGSSPPMSSDGKARRRRAQERGDIQSSSASNIAHHNSLVTNSTVPSPGSDSSLRASSVPTLSLSPTPRVPNKSQSINPAPMTCGIHPFRDHGSSQSTRSSMNSARSFSARRRASGHRRSMLSEVFTFEDIDDSSAIAETKYERGILSAAGSVLTTPGEPESPQRPVVADVLNHPGLDNFLAIMADMRTPKRPNMPRTSTTGTQVFTPSYDGVELDGLPVGLPKDIFAAKGNRRERTYL